MPGTPQRRRLLASALLAAATGMATPALAAPGLGEEVYAATVEPKEFELEARYGILAGGADAGEDNFRLEAGYGVSGNLHVAMVGEFEKEAGGSRKAEAIGFEAVYHLAHIGGIDIAAYGEAEIGLNGNPGAVEAKLLLQRRTRLWDLRFNLIAEKPLDSTAPTEFGYATSADVAVADNLRIGATAFGELGTGRHLFPYAEHFVGPIVKVKLPVGDHTLRVETGYLFAVAKARDDARGQVRLNLELEL